jgi:hypothetical protein
LDNDEFLAYSPYQEFEASESVSRRALREAFITFVENLKTSARANLGAHLDCFF